MKLSIPEHVTTIINTLTTHGHEAYAVGGCVRDSFLGREPEDWDITTSALPEEVKALFRRTIDTGIRHGTVTVMLDKTGYEVTTYRVDGDYHDGRHPSSVTFTPSLEEDLKRRDFTINAMAYNPETGLVDLFHGLEDLQRGVIRCVGNSADRFTEDALRILRAVRFSAQLGFTIEEETLKGLTKLAPNLELISKERIQVELTKLLTSPHPDFFRVVYETGISKVILPEFDAIMQEEQNNKYHCYTVGEHSIVMLKEVEATPVLRWSALLHDIGKPLVRTIKDGGDAFPNHGPVSAKLAHQILRGLRFDNDTIDKVTRLVQYHDYAFTLDKACVRKVMSLIGKDLFPDLLSLMWADNRAKSEFSKSYMLDAVRQIEVMYQEITAAGECTSLKELAVSGRDLIAAGQKPGKELGVQLQKMLEVVLEHPEYNTKEYLLQMIG